MHSGRDAKVSPLSVAVETAAGLLASARRLPASALRLIAALLAVVILALSLVGGCAAETSAEPGRSNGAPRSSTRTCGQG